jgi:bifunctional DNA-binding transcriptional regulator/antitoxin component of YhaV-PrlF toxin-antitoxin module
MVDSRGRLLLSDEVRAQLGVQPGDAVEVEVANGELRARRWVDPYGHLSPQELMAEELRWLHEHPEEAAAIAAEAAAWEHMATDLPREEWTDADFVSEAG